MASVCKVVTTTICYDCGCTIPAGGKAVAVGEKLRPYCFDCANDLGVVPIEDSEDDEDEEPLRWGDMVTNGKIL